MLSIVELDGLKELDPTEVSREVLSIVDSQPHPFWRSPRHAWFLDRARLSKELKKKLFANKIEVGKSYKKVLRLKVEEKTRKAILHSYQQFFWLDLQGVVANELSFTERKVTQSRLLGQRMMNPNDAPIMRYDLDKTINPGLQVIDAKEMAKWMDLAAAITEKGIKYRELEPPTGTSSTRAVIMSLDGFQVWIDTTDSLEAQLMTFKVFEERKPKSITVKEYVDVRIPGKVFVK